ncbi:hypothetical protein MPER_08252 [Moniliophthora perniciosa FA553]|nr:hypothetical protein MPER_08252 [Moniliophthora perniciosa FA553]
MPLDPTADADDSINQVVFTIRDFLDRLCYKPAVPNQEDRRRLEEIVRDDLARHIQSYHGERTVEWLDRCCTPGVALSQVISAGRHPPTVLALTFQTLDDLPRA